MKTYHLIFLLALLTISCSEGVQNGVELSFSEIEYINNLGLLNADESIMKFSSSMKFKSSGNFYTTERIAAYWIYAKEDERNFAFYEDIKSIDLAYGDGLVSASRLLVKVKNGKSFEVFFDCEKEELDEIYKEVQSFLN